MDIVNTENLRRTVIYIAWPAVLRTFLNMIVQIVDMAMVGRLGAVPLAAVGLGNQVFFFSVAVVQALSVGTTALVAQAIGKGDPETAKKVARQSLSAVLVTTFFLSILVVIFSQRIINGIVYFMPEKNLEIITLGGSYLGIVGISISLRFSLLVVNGIFQGAGDTRTPLYLMTLTNILNVIGNYFLIFGAGPFPALGVQGAALATCGAGLFGGGLGIVLLFSRFSPIPLNFRLSKFFTLQKQILSRVLRIGAPSAAEQIIIHSSRLLYSMVVASLGALAVAAQQILHNTYTMTYLPGIGFSLAATTLVGQCLGANKKKRALKSGMETTRLALLIMSAAELLFFFFPQTVTRLFTREAGVQELTAHPLMLLALTQPAIAYIVSLTGGLRGAGDTRWVMFLTLINMLGLRLGLTLLLVRIGWGLTGVWLAMLIESYLRAAFILYRFRHKIPEVKPLININD